jgi:hypothetical protein
VELPEILEFARDIKREHADILSTVDSAKTRIVTVESLYGQLSGLSRDQQEFLETAIEAARHGIYRAAIILAWSALVSGLHEAHRNDGYVELAKVRPKWKISGDDQLREEHPEFQLIDASRDAGLISKSQGKTLHGLLNTRNRAAHPGRFRTSLNRTLGYLEDIVSELGVLAGKP